MTITRLAATWARVPSWLRATITSTGQLLIASVLVTALGVIDDMSKNQPVDWLVVLSDVRSQLLIFAQAIVVAIWRRVRPPEQSYQR